MNTSNFNVMHFYEIPFTCQCKKENRFQIPHFCWSFSHDIIAVKGMWWCFFWFCCLAQQCVGVERSGQCSEEVNISCY